MISDMEFVNQNAIVQMYIVCCLVVSQLRNLVYSIQHITATDDLCFIYALIHPQVHPEVIWWGGG